MGTFAHLGHWVDVPKGRTARTGFSIRRQALLRGQLEVVNGTNGKDMVGIMQPRGLYLRVIPLTALILCNCTFGINSSLALLITWTGNAGNWLAQESTVASCDNRILITQIMSLAP